MEWFNILVIVFGLCLFEVISSVDNAIVNANILKTLPNKYRKIFLFWGIIFAVFVVRGLLPFVIILLTNHDLSVAQVFSSIFSNNVLVAQSLENTKPLLLIGGGIYLLLVFLSWLFLEKKNQAFAFEHFFYNKKKSFYLIIIFLLVTLFYLSSGFDQRFFWPIIIGIIIFSLVNWFQKRTENHKHKIGLSTSSAWSKMVYLEILDFSFSVDGVIGAFAFTTSIPLIILGNGFGAYLVRELTLRGIHLISHFAYIKNGAMYSIGVLGIVMISEAFGNHYPFWFVPLLTFSLLFLFLFISVKFKHRLVINE